MPTTISKTKLKSTETSDSSTAHKEEKILTYIISVTLGKDLDRICFLVQACPPYLLLRTPWPFKTLVIISLYPHIHFDLP